MGQDDLISGSRSPRRLTPTEFEQLVNALVDAFDRFGLQQLVLFELEEDLGQIAAVGTIRESAFELVQWSVRNGRLDDLVAGAVRRNPGNAELRRFRREVWGPEQTPPPMKPNVREIEGPAGRAVEGAAPVPPAVEDQANGTEKRSLGLGFTAFFQTLPGVLTGVAAVITAVVALVTVLNQIGMFDGKSELSSTPSAPVSDDGASAPPPKPSTSPPSASVISPGETLETTVPGGTIEDVAAATVLLSALIMGTENGNTSEYGQCFLGSGSVVSPDGRYILTNHQVLSLVDRAISYAAETEAELLAASPERQIALQFGEIVVSVVDTANGVPDPDYRAEVVKQDANLDLALLRITGDSPGVDHERPLRRPHLALDLSGAQSGEPVTVVGYPATWPVSTHGPGCPQTPEDRSIQLFPGTVSGFAELNNDQLEITASGTGGLVGGSVVNAENQLIGIPGQIQQMAAGGVIEVIPIERSTAMLEEFIPGITAPSPVGE
jgi:S1-C subfamily serine protease